MGFRPRSLTLAESCDTRCPRVPGGPHKDLPCSREVADRLQGSWTGNDETVKSGGRVVSEGSVGPSGGPEDRSRVSGGSP